MFWVVKRKIVHVNMVASHGRSPKWVAPEVVTTSHGHTPHRPGHGREVFYHPELVIFADFA